MSKLSRFSAILFALMLTVISMSGNHHEILLKQAIESDIIADHAAYFSEKKNDHLFRLKQQHEWTVSPLNNLPAPASKIHSYDFLSAAFSVELKIKCLISEYLAQAKEIDPSLSVAVIIFPFHHFW